MSNIDKCLLSFFIVIISTSCKHNAKEKATDELLVTTDYYNEPFRPQYHFSPEKMWMNDPNGMVYHNGTYHLFYQYYPDDIVWGPMHWGHAVSTDLVRWQHKPIAFYPDELGYIFSGSAVLDKYNSSGFGTAENPPLVAIYTYHNAERKKSGEPNFETQGIAYSLDNGDSWTKYEGNPVISDENSTDFRDPKVMWHEPTKKWVLTLVAGDHAEFYGSKNLKEWQLLSEFGKGRGAQGSVWECPDLFKLKVESTGEEKWILFISLGDAPNGGSGTQYFIGDFDGTNFTSDQTETQWIDWGTDNYAGVTFSNAPNNEKVFIGWMSNWMYAQKTPTKNWRSAMTLPRTLKLQKYNERYYVTSYPVAAIDKLIDREQKREIRLAKGAFEKITSAHLNQSEVRFMTEAKDFRLTFGNGKKEKVVLRLEGGETFSLDRSNSGITDFQEDFGTILQEMPLPNFPQGAYEVRILLDRSSIEVFINKGQYVMTAQLFPNEVYDRLEVENTSQFNVVFKDFQIGQVDGIW